MNFTKLIKKIKLIYKQGRLLRVLKKEATAYIMGAKYLFHDPTGKEIKIHCPNYQEPDPTEEKLVKRIFISFKKMKETQFFDKPTYKPSPLWQNHLDQDFKLFKEALIENNIHKFHYFLSNFGTWKTYHGVENVEIIRRNNSFLRKKYLKNTYFKNSIDFWKLYTGNTKPLTNLSYPQFGNQSGAFLKNKTFIGLDSCMSEINGSLLSNLLKDKHDPIIANLGAGYGRLDYFVLRNLQNSTFIDFDLPEILCLAIYYLMKTFPQKKVLMFGEGEFEPPNQIQKFDLIFMPPREIEKLPDNYIDLFINTFSLGEMKKNTAENYLNYITKSAKLFFHINQHTVPNIFSDGSKGLLAYEYKIPPEKFKLLSCSPHIGDMFDQTRIEGKNMFCFSHLYEKIL